MKGNEASGFIGLNAVRQQTIERERLVIAARHQAFDDVTADLLNREPLDDQRVEAVERAEDALHQPAALWRIGIGIGHVLEIVGQRRLAMHGNRWARLGQNRQDRIACNRHQDPERDRGIDKRSGAQGAKKLRDSRHDFSA
jgi:hypothetical protein